MFFPMKVDSHETWPVTFNYLLIVINLVLYALVAVGWLSINGFVLYQTDGLLAHAFIHGSLMHLLGNMLYLFLFGNVLCSHIGAVKYLACYFALIIGAAIIHLWFDGDPAVGASGAISGVLGMVFVLAPHAKVHVVWSMYYAAFMEAWKMPARWVIGSWFLWDLYGAFHGSGNIAYMAHVGGFVCGVLLAWWGTKINWFTVQPSYEEHNMIDVMEENAYE